MSLLKQLFLAICVFLVVAFSGSFLVSLEASRAQLTSQLRAHAQDAATALGLTLTANIDDPAMVELMVTSIFDSGYYASIRVINLADHSVMVERTSDPDEDDGAPAWFARLVDLPPQQGAALIMRGWQQAGQVQVLSHPRFALGRLWNMALGSLAWLSGCALLSGVFGGWLLRRQLRPLDAMRRQAEAIAQREFRVLEDLPSVPELRRVVLAMNQMVGKLKQLFAEEAARSDRLQEEAFQDPLTGLPNRRLFDARLNHALLAVENNSPGYVLTLRLDDLAGLNQRLGGQHTDALLCTVAQIFRDLMDTPHQQRWLAARNRGSEFSLLMPGTTAADAEQLGKDLSAQMTALFETGAGDHLPVAFVGITDYHLGQGLEQVMRELDQALATAQIHPQQPWAVSTDYLHLQAYTPHDWRDWIDQALSQGKIMLYCQPVATCGEPAAVVHRKVLARLLDNTGEAIAAGRFLPWVQRLGWATRLDRLMLEHTLVLLGQAPQPLALSLSSHTLNDPRAMQSILQTLAAHPAQARWLTLEADERNLPAEDVLQRLAREISNTGYGLGLQHFGGSFGQIGNLSHLGLAYLKLDGSYVHAIDVHPDKRLFIEAVVRTTRSIDLPLIAEMVETPEELAVLRELGVYGAMGRWIGAPGPLTAG
jgi:diguanylate cyclase (GGDEF)-like protein